MRIALPHRRWSRSRFAFALTAAVALAACSSSSDQRSEIADDPPAIEPQPTPDVAVGQTGPFKAADIMKALSGKSFSYRSRRGIGVVSYNGDGTFTYTEAGKGEGAGVWQASDGQLCEARDPTSFLPKGTRSECQPFSASDGGYAAGATRLTPT